MCKSEFEKDLERFKIALKTRNFEIELFWKRCSYFLAINTALVTALAAAMFALLNSSDNASFWPLLGGICLAGIFICIAWIQVVIGSKFWQTHWEWVVEKRQESIGFEKIHGADGTIREDYFSREGVNDRVADYLNMNAEAREKAEQEAEAQKNGAFLKYAPKMLWLSLKFLFGAGKEDNYNQLIFKKPSVSDWMQRTAIFFFWFWLLGGFLALYHSDVLAGLCGWLREGIRALCKMLG